MPVLREAMSLEPFLNLTFFAFLPAHFPEENPRHCTEEEGQEEAAVHQTIFQPSLRLLRSQKKTAMHQIVTSPVMKDKTTESQKSWTKTYKKLRFSINILMVSID